MTVAISMRMTTAFFRIPSSLIKYWEDGSILIASGVGLMAVSGTAMYLENQQQTIMNLVRTDLWDERRNNQGAFHKHLNKISEQPALYNAKVTRALGDLFDGPVALKGVKVGDIVQVLAVIGDGKYVRCRSFKESGEAVMEGWYPQKLLEAV